MMKTKRSRGKRRKQKSNSFDFGKLEPRQLFAGDLAGTAVLESGMDDVQQIQTSNHQETTVDRSIAQRIINGTQTDGYEAVGIVNGQCTGTLIAPNAVLTAAHCVEGIGNTQGTFEVGGKVYETTKMVIHPDYQSRDIDLAVMILSENVQGVDPMLLNRTAPEVGEVLTLVGFGATGTGGSGHDGSFGVKHEGETPIDDIDNDTIYWNFDNNSESNTAPGDSGGPAFLQQGGKYVIAGVTSGGTLESAGLGDRSFDVRVDSFTDWIDSIAGTSDSDGGGDTGDDTGDGDQSDGESEKTFTNNTKVNIPSDEVATVTTTVNATGMAGKITDVNVKLDIDHTYDSDLEVTLISPSGKRIPLFDAIGGDENNFKGTVLDSDSSTSIENADAPFTGTFSPMGDLSELDGEDPNGKWTLEVTDHYDLDGGRINSFAVTIRTDAGSTDGDSYSELAKKVDGELELYFVGDYFENAGGRGEKWIMGSDSFYYILPNGDLFRGGTFEKIASFNAEYHKNPKLLHAAGDPALAAKLDADLGLQFAGDYYENAGGVNEKWMKGDSSWYYILPNGTLKQGRNVIAHLDADYYRDPSLLHDASDRLRAADMANGDTRMIRVNAAADSYFESLEEEEEDNWWS